MTDKKPIRHDVRSVELVEVILVRNLRGSGVDESDPVRIVETWWLKDGTLLLEPAVSHIPKDTADVKPVYEWNA